MTLTVDLTRAIYAATASGVGSTRHLAGHIRQFLETVPSVPSVTVHGEDAYVIAAALADADWLTPAERVAYEADLERRVRAAVDAIRATKGARA